MKKEEILKRAKLVFTAEEDNQSIAEYAKKLDEVKTENVVLFNFKNQGLREDKGKLYEKSILSGSLKTQKIR